VEYLTTGLQKVKNFYKALNRIMFGLDLLDYPLMSPLLVDRCNGYYEIHRQKAKTAPSEIESSHSYG
jgi:hypothetical protein